MTTTEKKQRDVRAPEPATMAALFAEVRRARTIHPGRRQLLAALMEEVGELAKAIIEDAPREDIEEEAIHVAAVAIRILEEGDETHGVDPLHSFTGATG
jgi:hypothetical protein